MNVERKGQRLALEGNLSLSRYHIFWARLLSYRRALPMPCKALSTVPCTSNAKARFTQHASVRVDGRESLSDVLHDGYEELLKGLMQSRPTAGERQEGMILRWGRELFGAGYNGLGLAMSEASKLLKATSALRVVDRAALVFASGCTGTC